MRLMFAVALAAAALTASPAATPISAAPLFPWCAHYMMKGGGITCAFGTLNQCLRMISGVGGSCQRNPYIEDAPPTSRKAKHKRHRHAQR